MKPWRYLAKEQQQIMPLFGGAFVENKPIPFPERGRTQAYSSLFYWAHLEAYETSEFPLHPHEGFEIMTFVFEGSLEHYDTATQVWTPMHEGGVQVIRAGSGVQHAERIVKGTRLFQIWFDPDFSRSLRERASYEDYPPESFEMYDTGSAKVIEYIGEKGPILAQTPGIEVMKMTLEKGQHQFKREADATYSYYLLSGQISLDETLMQKDGFLVMEATQAVACEVLEDAELFVIKTPTKVGYPRFIERYPVF